MACFLSSGALIDRKRYGIDELLQRNLQVREAIVSFLRPVGSHL
jgi:hypothetical protein